jgi:hypothetical protein
VDCVEIRKALEESLDFLGAESKRVVLYHMTTRCGISLADENCSSLAEIDRELHSILGEGATVVMWHVNRKLDASRGRRAAIPP